MANTMCIPFAFVQAQLVRDYSYIRMYHGSAASLCPMACVTEDSIGTDVYNYYYLLYDLRMHSSCWREAAASRRYTLASPRLFFSFL